jgi:hypothetical protein
LPDRILTPVPASPPTSLHSNALSNQSDVVLKNGDEWSSPAFIKRARTSYGSLFDTGYDPFSLEDGTVSGKGRKRTRLSSTWRYSSRSPSPERSEQSVYSTPLEPAAALAPTTTDEGSQTVGLEVGNAAEALAEFSRQATNDQSTLKSDEISLSGGQVLHEARLDRHDGRMGPPAITAGISSNIGSSLLETESQEAEPNQAPLSPRLKPVPSDTLPLVSPLTTSKSTLFTHYRDINENSLNFNDKHVASAVDVPSPRLEEDQEDLYGVSPNGCHGQPNIGESQGFQNPANDSLEARHSGFEGQFLSEDQYDHWQGSVHMTPSKSPQANISESAEEQPNRFSVQQEEEEGAFGHDGLPLSRMKERHYQQYPNLNDELHGQAVGTAWVHASAKISYPDLPGSEVGSDHDVGDIRHEAFQSAAMSRSQSTQSEVVDLTESDKEERVPFESSDDEEGTKKLDVDGVDGSVDGSIEEDRASLERPIHSQYFQRAKMHVSDGEASLEDEEFDEADVEEDSEDEIYPPGNGLSYEDEYDSEEKEEGSYDEEEDEIETAQTRVSIQQAPVVIDLLSSDDEDNENEVAPEPAIPNSQPLQLSRHQQEASPAGRSSEDDEDSESDEGTNSEDEIDSVSNVLYAQGPEQQSSFSSQRLSNHALEEDEDAPFIVDNDSERNAIVEDEREEVLEEDSYEGSKEEPEPEDLKDFKMVLPKQPIRNDDSVRAEANASEVMMETEQQDDDATQIHEVLEIEEQGKDSRNVTTGQRLRILEIGELRSPAAESIKAIESMTTAEEQPSPLAKAFGLDGANDEPRKEFLYPVLRPNDSVIMPPAASVLNRKLKDTTISEDQLFKNTNIQLQTPDATQLSQLTEPQSASFSFISSRELPPLSGEVTIDPALEDSKHVEEQSKQELDRPVERNISMNDLEKVETRTICEETFIDEDASEDKEKVTEVEAIFDPPDQNLDLKEQYNSDLPIIDNLKEDPRIVQVSPRRSQRIGKASGSATEKIEAPRPATPINSRTEAEQNTSDVDTTSPSPTILDGQVTPTGHDASIEMAMAALDSPTKIIHDLRRTPIVDLKIRLSRALRTELGEFTALKVLRYNISKKLDVLAIATTTPAAPERAKVGPRHYQITFNITDPSIAPSGVTEVQVFRPYKDALPVIQAGDGILLRDFQVIALKNRGFALRSDQNDASSWAVFKDGQDEAEIRGPPVEYGVGEKSHIFSMKEWYGTLDSAALAKLKRANVGKTNKS